MGNKQLITKKDLIDILLKSEHPEETPVVIYLNETEDLEDVIGDIAFIESVDLTIDDRIDLNAMYKSFI